MATSLASEKIRNVAPQTEEEREQRETAQRKQWADETEKIISLSEVKDDEIVAKF